MFGVHCQCDCKCHNVFHRVENAFSRTLDRIITAVALAAIAPFALLVFTYGVASLLGSLIMDFTVVCIGIAVVCGVALLVGAAAKEILFG